MDTGSRKENASNQKAGDKRAAQIEWFGDEAFSSRRILFEELPEDHLCLGQPIGREQRPGVGIT